MGLHTGHWGPHHVCFFCATRSRFRYRQNLTPDSALLISFYLPLLPQNRGRASRWTLEQVKKTVENASFFCSCAREASWDQFVWPPFSHSGQWFTCTKSEATHVAFWAVRARSCRDQILAVVESCVLLSPAILGLCYTAGYLVCLGVNQNWGTTVLRSYSTVLASNINCMYLK